jgi:hypothetical protein
MIHDPRLQTTPEPSGEVDACNQNIEHSAFEPTLNEIGLEVLGAAIGDVVDGPEVGLRKEPPLTTEKLGM